MIIKAFNVTLLLVLTLSTSLQFEVSIIVIIIIIRILYAIFSFPILVVLNVDCTYYSVI